jgi:hypothetical protein
MARSPASAADAKALLRAAAARWDQAYEALQRGDDGRIGVLLGEVDGLLPGLPPPVDDDAEAAVLRRTAAEAHGRLLAGIVGTVGELRAELGRARQGRRVLAGYRDPTAGVGDRVETRA